VVLDPDSFIGLAALISVLLQIAGAWILHRKLRIWQSRLLLVSWLSLVVWVPVISIAQYQIGGAFETSSSKELLNWIYVALDVFLPAAILLLTSISFLLVARASPSTRGPSDVA
jgi:hypothetical protein